MKGERAWMQDDGEGTRKLETSSASESDDIRENDTAGQ